MSSQPNLSATRGNPLGVGIFKLLLSCGGYRLSLLLARAVTWFYAQFDRTAFSATSDYLKLRFPEDAGSACALKRHFHRLIYQLARMLIISYRMGGGKAIGLEEVNAQYIPETGGVVFVLAHYGCWQASMELLNRKSGRHINIMARPDRNASMDKFLAVKKQQDFSVIDTDGFSGGLIEASAALERGEAVVIMGDRAVEGTAGIRTEYFAGEIELPLSPWMVAARNNVPAIPVFTEFKEEPERVVIRYCPPIRFPAQARRIRPEELLPGIRQYARELEEAAVRSPYSVFRFGNEKAT